MPLTVWKYEIPMIDAFSLTMPEDAQILTVQVQAAPNGVMMWALVNPQSPPVQRRFRLAGTGHPIDEDSPHLRFLGTFQLDRGTLVFHVFELLTGTSEC